MEGIAALDTEYWRPQFILQRGSHEVRDDFPPEELLLQHQHRYNKNNHIFVRRRHQHWEHELQNCHKLEPNGHLAQTSSNKHVFIAEANDDDNSMQRFLVTPDHHLWSLYMQELETLKKTVSKQSKADDESPDCTSGEKKHRTNKSNKQTRRGILAYRPAASAESTEISNPVDKPKEVQELNKKNQLLINQKSIEPEQRNRDQINEANPRVSDPLNRSDASSTRLPDDSASAILSQGDDDDGPRIQTSASDHLKQNSNAFPNQLSETSEKLSALNLQYIGNDRCSSGDDSGDDCDAMFQSSDEQIFSEEELLVKPHMVQPNSLQNLETMSNSENISEKQQEQAHPHDQKNLHQQQVQMDFEVTPRFDPTEDELLGAQNPLQRNNVTTDPSTFDKNVSEEDSKKPCSGNPKARLWGRRVELMEHQELLWRQQAFCIHEPSRLQRPRCHPEEVCISNTYHTYLAIVSIYP